jgi:hypothetical protein
MYWRIRPSPIIIRKCAHSSVPPPARYLSTVLKGLKEPLTPMRTVESGERLCPLYLPSIGSASCLLTPLSLSLVVLPHLFVTVPISLRHPRAYHV